MLGIHNVTKVSAGENHTCALTAVGSVRCWGDNATGELGDGSTSDSHRPVSVVGMDAHATWVSAGGNYTCGVRAGVAKCWGYNMNGQLGDETRASATRRAVCQVSATRPGS